MIVVDTNVWSELTKLEPSTRVVDWELASAPWLYMSTIALAEWRAGAALMPFGRNRDALSAIIEAVVVVVSVCSPAGQSTRILLAYKPTQATGTDFA